MCSQEAVPLTSASISPSLSKRPLLRRLLHHHHQGLITSWHSPKQAPVPATNEGRDCGCCCLCLLVMQDIDTHNKAHSQREGACLLAAGQTLLLGTMVVDHFLSREKLVCEEKMFCGHWRGFHIEACKTTS